MRRTQPRPYGTTVLDGVRILASLPGEWRKDLRQANGDVVIRVQADDESAQIRARATRALTDSALHEWEIVACDPVAGEHASEDG